MEKQTHITTITADDGPFIFARRTFLFNTMPALIVGGDENSLRLSDGRGNQWLVPATKLPDA